MMTTTKRINDGKIRDMDIRVKFIERNKKFFGNENFEFANEYGINSTNIVDLALFDFKNKLFYGFEIKSEQDNVRKLYKQLNAYITFFNIVYVITHTKLTEKVLEIIDSNKQFDRVGIIEVNSALEFKEIRRARKYSPWYPLFIQNLDLDELRRLALKYDVPVEGSKKVLLGKLRRYVQESDIYEGLNDKINKYYRRTCSKCGSHLYYNKSTRSGVVHVCYNCGASSYN